MSWQCQRSRGCSTAAIDPILGNKASAPPSRDDRVREPGLPQIGMVGDYYLKTGRKFLAYVRDQLEQSVDRFAVFVGQYREVPVSVLLSRIVRLRGLIEE